MDIILLYNNKLSGIRMLFYLQRHKLVCDRAILLNSTLSKVHDLIIIDYKILSFYSCAI